MPDRFKLEDKITQVSTTRDKLDMVVSAFDTQQITSDEAIVALKGLSVILNLVEMELFDTFKEVFQLDEYRPNELIAKPNKRLNRHQNKG